MKAERREEDSDLAFYGSVLAESPVRGVNSRGSSFTGGPPTEDAEWLREPVDAVEPEEGEDATGGNDRPARRTLFSSIFGRTT